jgi:hypothetical protein
MRFDLFSALLGVAALPSAALAWWALWRTKVAVLAHVHSSIPTSAAQRAAFAARVYSGRRVLVLRLPELALAVTLGRSRGEEQRAATALLNEFTLIPARPVRIKGRTW